MADGVVSPHQRVGRHGQHGDGQALDMTDRPRAPRLGKAPQEAVADGEQGGHHLRPVRAHGAHGSDVHRPLVAKTTSWQIAGPPLRQRFQPEGAREHVGLADLAHLGIDGDVGNPEDGHDQFEPSELDGPAGEVPGDGFAVRPTARRWADGGWERGRASTVGQRRAGGSSRGGMDEHARIEQLLQDRLGALPHEARRPMRSRPGDEAAVLGQCLAKREQIRLVERDFLVAVKKAELTRPGRRGGVLDDCAAVQGKREPVVRSHAVRGCRGAAVARERAGGHIH